MLFLKNNIILYLKIKLYILKFPLRAPPNFQELN